MKHIHLRQMLTVCLALCLTAALCACAPHSGDAPSDTPSDSGGPNLTPAQTYLAETSDIQLFNVFLKATYITSYFTSPASITSKDLYRFFVLAADDDLIDECYDEQDKLYRIPVSAVTQVLDTYLEGYSFDPADPKVQADYDSEADALNTTVLGFGTGRAYYFLYSAEAISMDTVRVELSNMYGNNEVITAKVVDGGARFLSRTLTDYAIGADEPPEEITPWQLDENALTDEYLISLVIDREIELGDKFVFSDPDELSSDSLYILFLGTSDYDELEEKYWHDDEKLFYFPAEPIIAQLSNYLKHFNYDITQDHKYDAAANAIVTPLASGFGGDRTMKVTGKTVDGNVVTFTADFYVDSQWVDGEWLGGEVYMTKTYSIELREDGFYYLSAVVDWERES